MGPRFTLETARRYIPGYSLESLARSESVVCMLLFCAYHCRCAFLRWDVHNFTSLLFTFLYKRIKSSYNRDSGSEELVNGWSHFMTTTPSPVLHFNFWSPANIATRLLPKWRLVWGILIFQRFSLLSRTHLMELKRIDQETKSRRSTFNPLFRDLRVLRTEYIFKHKAKE